MTAATPDDPAAPDGPVGPHDPGPARYGDAFAVADALAVHGSTCVCPPCAGRLPLLLRDLARAIEVGAADAARPAGR
jgi:hypothetical protein